MMYIQYCIHLYTIQSLFPVISITIYFFQIDRIKNEINRNSYRLYTCTSLEIYVKTSTDTLSNCTIVCVLISNTCNYRMPNAEIISNVSYWPIKNATNIYWFRSAFYLGNYTITCKTHRQNFFFELSCNYLLLYTWAVCVWTNF